MLDELSPLRIGCVSASRIADIMAKGKGVSRAKYAAQLAAERLSGRPHRANFTSAAMDHGNEYEGMAGTKYAFRNIVTLSGSGKDWVPHPFIEFAGCSPDRFVDDDGLLEIKNPETHTLFRYFETVEIPQDYKWQMTWQLACTRRKWCDWVAHDPDLPDEDGYLEVRFEPCSKDVADLEREVRFFNAEVEHLIQLAIKRRKS